MVKCEVRVRLGQGKLFNYKVVVRKVNFIWVLSDGVKSTFKQTCAICMQKIYLFIIGFLDSLPEYCCKAKVNLVFSLSVHDEKDHDLILPNQKQEVFMQTYNYDSFKRFHAICLLMKA